MSDEMTDYIGLRFWFDILQFLATGAIGIYVWWGNRERVTNDRIVGLEERFDSAVAEHTSRLDRIEESMKHAPSHRDIGGIHQRLDAMHGDLRELKGQMDVQASETKLILQHLIEGARQ